MPCKRFVAVPTEYKNVVQRFVESRVGGERGGGEECVFYTGMECVG